MHPRLLALIRIARSQYFWVTVLLSLSVAFLLLYILYMTIISLSYGYNVNTYATNGTFQLYNPLRRMSEGQVPGVTFPFFHGIGVLYAHYPVFSLLGENVFSAEVAKHFISPVFFLLSSFSFFLAFFKNLRKALIGTAIMTLLSLYTSHIMYPGNSLIGVRSSLPIFAAAAMLWASARTFKIKRYTVSVSQVLIPTLLAASFLAGTEHGIAAIISYFIVKTFVLYRQNKQISKLAIGIGIRAIAVIVSILTITTVLTKGNPIPAIHYALLEIPSDQGWYFGAPPNVYLTWSNAVERLLHKAILYKYLPTTLFTAIALTLAYRTKCISPLQLQVFAYLTLAGAIAFTAGILGGYYEPVSQLKPLYRAICLIAVSVGLLLLFEPQKWTIKPRTTSLSPKHIFKFKLISLSILIGLIVCMILSINTYVYKVRSYNVRGIFTDITDAAESNDYSVSSDDWKKRMDTFIPHIPADASVWSTYTSLYDSSLSKLNASPGGEDYIIHALGESRRSAYEKKFIESNPDFAITLKPSYFKYEEWLWSRHWNFYQHLLTDYEIVTENDSHILWKVKKLGSTSTEAADLPVNITDTPAIPANTSEYIKVYTVTIDYSVQSGLPGSSLKNIPRYLVDIENSKAMQYSVALNPHAKTWSFPVVLLPGESPVTLKPRTDGIIPLARIDVKKVTYSELNISKNNTYLFHDNYCVKLKPNLPKTCKETLSSYGDIYVQ